MKSDEAGSQNRQLADPAGIQTLPSLEGDVCHISKSIEAVLLSKSENRKQRALARARNIRYQTEIRRPIVCLAFVLPMVFLYELGAIWLGRQSIRSGIDQWFHQNLYQLGFGELVVLPIITIAVLVYWHHRKRDHWQFRISLLTGMFAEAIGLGLILFWAANAIDQLADGAQAPAATAVLSQNAWWANIVACVGSGIYEELVFRIGLLSVLIVGANKLFPGHLSAALTGVIAVSLLFAALHYSVFNPAGNPFEVSSFMFRFFASTVFCILFLFRGFGIAVGAHVAYDVLTQI